MKASSTALLQIKKFEGLRLKAYKCPAGVWTIGYGHTKGVKAGMVITEQKASQYLDDDVQTVCRQLEALSLPDMTQGQQDAVIDFVFNLGITKFKSSTLCRKIKANVKDTTIPTQFTRWVYAAGKVLPGLQRRREWEVQMWKS